jgi:hypothetical protein
MAIVSREYKGHTVEVRGYGGEADAQIAAYIDDVLVDGTVTDPAEPFDDLAQNMGQASHRHAIEDVFQAAVNKIDGG